MKKIYRKILEQTRPEFREFIAIFLGSIILLIINSLLLKARASISGDALNYFRLVLGDYESINHLAHLYRILSPLIVKVLCFITGFEVSVAFNLLTVLSLLTTAIVFYYFLRDIGFSRTYCALGLFFLLESNIFVYLLWNPWIIDPLSLLLMLAAIWAIVKNKIWLYIVFLILGALNKGPYALFTIPVFYLWNLKQGRILDFKLILKSILLFLILLATITLIAYSGVIPKPYRFPKEAHYWSYRLGKISLSEYYDKELKEKKAENIKEERTWSFKRTSGIPRMIYGGWHVLWMLAILGCIVKWRKHPYVRMWILTLVLMMLPLYITPGRLPAIVYPFVIIFALWELEFLASGLSKFSKYFAGGLFSLLYRLYVLFDVRDTPHIKRLEKIGFKDIGFNYYPIAMTIFFAIAPILLHIYVVSLQKEQKKKDEIVIDIASKAEIQ